MGYINFCQVHLYGSSPDCSLSVLERAGLYKNCHFDKACEGYERGCERETISETKCEIFCCTNGRDYTNVWVSALISNNSPKPYICFFNATWKFFRGGLQL